MAEKESTRLGRTGAGAWDAATNASSQSLAPRLFNPQPRCQACPTAAHSWEWVSLLTGLALAGDGPARDQLPVAVAHALEIEATA